MTRFFFNIHNDINTKDLEGIELSGLAAAKDEACKDIDDIVHARFETIDGDWSKWSIEICDRRGKMLLVVPFVSN